MLFSQQNIYIFPIAVAIAGFLLARYIYAKKKKKEKLICLLDSDCDAVVHSRYSTFLGVPLEIYGMIYFALIALFLLSSIFISQLNSPLSQIIIFVTTFVSCLFSLYLASIQIILIRQWCMWCLLSTALNVLLFASIAFTSPLNIKGLIINIINKLIS